MSFMEEYIDSRTARSRDEVKIYFSVEPLVFSDKYFMPATLGIGERDNYFISFDYFIDSDLTNFLHIEMLQGIVPYNKQKH